MKSVLAVLATLLLPAAALAHHGWSGYDAGKPMTLTGVVKESGYEHPHGHVRLEAPGKTWLVVLAPPSRMERRGLAREQLAVGTKATVHGYPHREHGEEMRAEWIEIGGTKTELR